MEASRGLARKSSSIRRLGGIALGFGNQFLFLITVWYLFWFLRNGAISDQHGRWFLRDCGLAVLFAVSHSVMLVPASRTKLSRWIPAAFYDSVFCVVTCLSLMMLFFGWRTSETALWQASGWAETSIRVRFLPDVGRIVVLLEPDRIGIPKRLDSVLLLAPQPRAAAAGVQTTRCLQADSAPGLFQLSWPGLAHASDVVGSRSPDGNLDRVHLLRQLLKRSPLGVLHWRFLSKVSGKGSRLPADAGWTSWPAR